MHRYWQVGFAQLCYHLHPQSHAPFHTVAPWISDEGPQTSTSYEVSQVQLLSSFTAEPEPPQVFTVVPRHQRNSKRNHSSYPKRTVTLQFRISIPFNSFNILSLFAPTSCMLVGKKLVPLLSSAFSLALKFSSPVKC
jgi:hypothetical protein